MDSEEKRCDRCGWPLAATTREGCTAENCSMRPMPPKRPTVAAPRDGYDPATLRRVAGELEAEWETAMATNQPPRSSTMATVRRLRREAEGGK